MAKCYICRSDLTKEDGLVQVGEWEKIACSVCGQYAITQSAVMDIENKPANLALSAYVREWNLALPPGAKPPTFTSYDLETLLDNLPQYSVSEKQDRLLANLVAVSEHPGHVIVSNSKKDFVLAWAANPIEYTYYLKSLIDRKLLELVGNERLHAALNKVTVASDGWSAFEEMTKNLVHRLAPGVCRHVIFPSHGAGIYGSAKAWYRGCRLSRL